MKMNDDLLVLLGPTHGDIDNFDLVFLDPSYVLVVNVDEER